MNVDNPRRDTGPVEPGSHWLDRNPAQMPDWRRIVQVTVADPSGYVEGVGWWQRRRGGQWRDAPATSRKTRVRYGPFTRRYQRLDEPAEGGER